MTVLLDLLKPTKFDTRRLVVNRSHFVLVVALASVFASGCGGGADVPPALPGPPASGNAPPGQPGQLGNASPSQVETRSVWPEYRTLATHLGQELKPGMADFRNNKSITDVVAEGHAAVLDLRKINSGDGEINYIASQGAAAYAEAVRRMERINALPRPASDAKLLGESFVHVLYGNVYAVYALGVKTDNRRQAILDELTGLMASVEKADAAHLLLPRVAERYAAPLGTNDGRVALNFDESWNAWGPHDWCGFYNGGDDIEDCTVVVEIKGKGGQTRKNVHFVRRWPGKSWLYARYDPGTPVGDRVLGRMTVLDVVSVDARVLSPKFSTEVHYLYSEAEKARDIKDRIEQVKPHITFRVRNSAFGAKSGKVLVLENKLKHPVYKVGVRVTSAGGAAVGEFVKPTLDSGGTMDVGGLQVSRNLLAGDTVTVWIGEALLLTTTIP